MQATTEIKLTAEDWELLVELLEREGEELPAEIHHTRSREYRIALHRRMDQIKGLLQQLRQSAQECRTKVSTA